jgi:hypothetical protein
VRSDYYRILGLQSEPSPTAEQIKTAFTTAALQYHPDKIATSSVQPPLNPDEATACFQAINEIKAILLSHCIHVTGDTAGVSAGAAADEEKIEAKSADDLSPGEQLKTVIYAYIRSARFCEYPSGTGPNAPGYWANIPEGDNGIELGCSRFSGNAAIATPDYHVELGDVHNLNKPLTVYDKNNGFEKLTNPQEINSVLGMMADSVPKRSRDNSARTYGSHVREVPAVMKQPPFVIEDAMGNNYVDAIRRNSDDSFTILGRNTSGYRREITLYQDGSRSGYDGKMKLGIAEEQFYQARKDIFNHFDINLSEEMPEQDAGGRLRY